MQFGVNVSITLDCICSITSGSALAGQLANRHEGVFLGSMYYCKMRNKPIFFWISDEREICKYLLFIEDYTVFISNCSDLERT